MNQLCIGLSRWWCVSWVRKREGEERENVELNWIGSTHSYSFWQVTKSHQFIHLFGHFFFFLQKKSSNPISPEKTSSVIFSESNECVGIKKMYYQLLWKEGSRHEMWTKYSNNVQDLIISTNLSLLKKIYVPLCPCVCVYICHISACDLRGRKRVLAPRGPGVAGSCEPLTQVLALGKINTEPSLQSQIYSILYLPPTTYLSFLSKIWISYLSRPWPAVGTDCLHYRIRLSPSLIPGSS